MDNETTNENGIYKTKRNRKKRRFKALRKLVKKLKYDDMINIAFGVVIGDIIFEGIKALVRLI